jgi:hypothetical protein
MNQGTFLMRGLNKRRAELSLTARADNRFTQLIRPERSLPANLINQIAIIMI